MNIFGVLKNFQNNLMAINCGPVVSIELTKRDAELLAFDFRGIIRKYDVEDSTVEPNEMLFCGMIIRGPKDFRFDSVESK